MWIFHLKMQKESIRLIFEIPRTCRYKKIEDRNLKFILSLYFLFVNRSKKLKISIENEKELISILNYK